jgi:xylitol oxidase
LKVVLASGDVISLSRATDLDEFDGTIVSLGALGVVVEVTLDLVPTFQVAQTVYEDLPFATLEHNFKAITDAAYSVSLFTFWSSEKINQIWVKSCGAEGLHRETYGAKPASGMRSPLPDGVVENCTEQMCIPGPWYDRLPHFRFGFTPSSGEELQTEYFVSREDSWQALKAIDQMRNHIAPLLHTSEIRCIAADNLWISPNYQRESVAIHFTWKRDWERVSKLLPEIEKQLEPFNPRPHWGKLFAMSSERVQDQYEKLLDFRHLLKKYDPKGKFRNEFIQRYVF